LRNHNGFEEGSPSTMSSLSSLFRTDKLKLTEQVAQYDTVQNRRCNDCNEKQDAQQAMI